MNESELLRQEAERLKSEIKVQFNTREDRIEEIRKNRTEYNRIEYNRIE